MRAGQSEPAEIPQMGKLLAAGESEVAGVWRWRTKQCGTIYAYAKVRRRETLYKLKGAYFLVVLEASASPIQEGSR